MVKKALPRPCKPLDDNENLFIYLGFKKPMKLWDHYIEERLSLKLIDTGIFLSIDVLIKFKKQLFAVTIGVLKDKKTNLIIDDLKKVIVIYENYENASYASDVKKALNDFLNNNNVSLSSSASPSLSLENFVTDLIIQKIQLEKPNISPVDSLAVKSILTQLCFYNKTDEIDLASFWNTVRPHYLANNEKTAIADTLPNISLTASSSSFKL